MSNDFYTMIVNVKRIQNIVVNFHRDSIKNESVVINYNI